MKIPLKLTTLLLAAFLCSMCSASGIEYDASIEEAIPSSDDDPSLDTASRQSKAAIIMISVKFITFATLFKNGEKIGKIRGHGLRRFVTTCNPGDVYALKAVDRKNTKSRPRIAMDIFHNGKHHGTGIYAYKARLNFDRKDHPENDWKSKKFSSCNWMSPDIRSIQKLPIPAKYVWLNNAPKKGTALFRYVVGGEHCKHLSNDNYCPCRPIFNTERIYCYYFRNKSSKYGRCNRRKCETKYECVPGAKNLPICVRRYAFHQIIKKAMHANKKFLCKAIPVDPPTEFWVLY